jgi:hypothetical protein
MPIRYWIRTVGAAFLMLLTVAVIVSWRADRRDRTQLAGELASTKKALAEADTRQHERDTQLAQTLSALANLKRTIVTPAQIVRELPSEIPLPTPITLQSATPANSLATEVPAAPNLNSPAPPATDGKLSQAVIPAEDLKPLYDFALECKACQAKLTAAQSDLTDERTKTAALAHERDDALRLARGGNVWRRLGRAAKWFVIGAAAGAIAAKASH